MALGKREQERQESLWVETARLAAPGHHFYIRLNKLLREAGFDPFLEELCAPYYHERGRKSIPPGVYFRMLMVGYFEGIDSQRGIAWRCADSLSLRQFLGLPLDRPTPDHSSLTRIRDRFPVELYERVFQFILEVIGQHDLLSGQTVGVDSTTLEANAAMKSIVRKGSGEDWNAYVTGLMREDGVIEDDEDPSDDERRKFDQQRKRKKVSNKEWESPSDPDARIIRMKDGRTHLGYKAEHVVDLQHEIILSARVLEGTASDAGSLPGSLIAAQVNLIRAGSEDSIEEVTADKGYHSNETLSACSGFGVRTYIPEPESKYERVWVDKPAEHERAVINNRQRMRRAKGKRLQRARSEKVERSFAHTCETGGGRRTWLRGFAKINKRYLLQAASRNLGTLMRSLFGYGSPRGLQGAVRGLLWFCVAASVPFPTRASAIPRLFRFITRIFPRATCFPPLENQSLVAA